MSDIKVNDLVMVVRHKHKCAVSLAKHGGGIMAFGIPFTVTSIVDVARCACGWEPDEPSALGFKQFGVPLSWLKRIDPLPAESPAERETVA